MDRVYINIRNRRKALGMTQKELADKAGYTDHTTINKMENEQVVDRFLSENKNFELKKQHCPIENAINEDEKVTFLSQLTGFDGFFVAVLKKMW